MLAEALPLVCKLRCLHTCMTPDLKQDKALKLEIVLCTAVLKGLAHVPKLARFCSHSRLQKKRTCD